MATNVYVDRPNPYDAALRNCPVRWFDVTTWCEQLLPDHDGKRVRYFTAWAHPTVERQQVTPQAGLDSCAEGLAEDLGASRPLPERAVRLREPRKTDEHLETAVRMKGSTRPWPASC
jgi:hypothetical protein